MIFDRYVCMHHTDQRDLCVGLPRECKCFAFLLRKPVDWWGKEKREREKGGERKKEKKEETLLAEVSRQYSPL